MLHPVQTISRLICWRFLASLVVAFTAFAPAVGCAQADDRDVDIILARPLFEPDRHARSEVSVAKKQLHVTGVVGEGDRWTAIFSGTPGVNGALAIGAGGEIDGWRVVSVSPSLVRLARDRETQTLVPAQAILHGIKPGY